MNSLATNKARYPNKTSSPRDRLAAFLKRAGKGKEIFYWDITALLWTFTITELLCRLLLSQSV